MHHGSGEKEWSGMPIEIRLAGAAVPKKAKERKIAQPARKFWGFFT